MIDYLSASSIDTFLRCQCQWRFRYIEGIKSPPSVAMAQGTGVHASAEYNFAYKIDTHEDAPQDECLDVARDEFYKAAEDITEWKDKPSVALDQTIGMAKAYHVDLAPTVQPVAVERKVVVEHNRWIFPLLGYLDVEEDTRVIDLKTSGKKKTQTDIDTSMQAGIYLLSREQDGKPATFDWHVAVKTKTPTTQVLTRSCTDHGHTVAFVERVQEAIIHANSTGTYTPALPGQWWCTEKFCGYWDRCEFGGKR